MAKRKTEYFVQYQHEDFWVYHDSGPLHIHMPDTFGSKEKARAEIRKLRKERAYCRKKQKRLPRYRILKTVTDTTVVPMSPRGRFHTNVELDIVHTIEPPIREHKGRQYYVTYCGVSFCAGTRTDERPDCKVCAKASKQLRVVG